MGSEIQIEDGEVGILRIRLFTFPPIYREEKEAGMPGRGNRTSSIIVCQCVCRAETCLKKQVQVNCFLFFCI